MFPAIKYRALLCLQMSNSIFKVIFPPAKFTQTYSYDFEVYATDQCRALVFIINRGKTFDGHLMSLC